LAAEHPEFSWGIAAAVRTSRLRHIHPKSYAGQSVAVFVALLKAKIPHFGSLPGLGKAEGVMVGRGAIGVPPHARL
jgi:hypothetical protein